jgi:hypothetical protein
MFSPHCVELLPASDLQLGVARPLPIYAGERVLASLFAHDYDAEYQPRWLRRRELAPKKTQRNLWNI